MGDKWHCLKNKQEGGDHYKGDCMEPAQYIAENKIGFLAGSAIKYLSRYPKKKGAEDLKKAIHFAQMALEAEYGIQSDVTYIVKETECANLEKAFPPATGVEVGLEIWGSAIVDTGELANSLDIDAGRELLVQAGFARLSDGSRSNERRQRGPCVAVWLEDRWVLRGTNRAEDGTKDIVLESVESIRKAVETFTS